MANVTDSFDRADSSTSLGTTDTGQTWTAEVGTWGISSNQAYLVSSGGDGQNTAWVETSKTDGTVQVKLSVVEAGTDAGLLLRFVDANNYYIAIENSGVLRFYRRLAGSFVELSSVSSATVSGDVLSVIMSGGNFDFRVNGVAKLNVNDGTHVGTKHGIRFFGGVATRFDDFAFTEVVVPPSPSFRVNRLRPAIFKPGLAR